MYAYVCLTGTRTVVHMFIKNICLYKLDILCFFIEERIVLDEVDAVKIMHHIIIILIIIVMYYNFCCYHYIIITSTIIITIIYYYYIP